MCALDIKGKRWKGLPDQKITKLLVTFVEYHSKSLGHFFIDKMFALSTSDFELVRCTSSNNARSIKRLTSKTMITFILLVVPSYLIRLILKRLYLMEGRYS